MKIRIVVGIHSCKEVFLIRPKAIKALFLRQGYESSADLREIQALATTHRIPVKPISPQKLDQMSHGHQGVALEVDKAPELNWSTLEEKSHSLILGLDGIEDPHNLGAILRTSWLMGVDAILTPKDRSVGLTATANKVACGGAEHVPVEVHTNLASPLAILKEKGYWVFGLSEKAKQSIWDLKAPEKMVLVIGAEGQGIRGQTQKICDEFLTIPQIANGPSYNASVAAAIAVSEIRRQWSPKKKA